MGMMRRLASVLAVRSLSRGSPHVGVEQITVHPLPEAAGCSLRVSYILRRSGPKLRRPLVILAERSHGVRLEPVRSQVPPGRERQQLKAARGLVVDLPASGDWEGAVIDLRTGWPTPPDGDAIQSCMLIPEELPRLLVEQRSGPQPRIKVAETAGTAAEAFVCGGVPLDLGVPTDAENLLSAVLVRSTATVLEAESNSVAITGRFQNELSLHEQQRVVRLLSRILEFHAETFGVAPQARLVLAPHDGAAAMGGPLLRLRTLQPLGLQADQDPEDVMLASRLASVWWGTGCRVTGPCGRELEAAIRAATAMLWADQVGGVFRHGVFAAWQERARYPVLYDVLSSWRQGFRHGLHARMTLALYSSLKRDASASAALRLLTEQYWGKFVPSHLLRRQLVETGVSLPHW
jgi:hypothetical protein